MEKITKEQIKRIYAMLPARIKGDKEEKEALIVQFTEDEEKRSTKDLTWLQAEELIISLGGTNKKYLPYAKFDHKNSQHRKMLSLAITLGWAEYNEKYNKMVADLERLGGWIATMSIYKKPLLKHTKKELTQLIAQFEKVVKSYSKT